MLTIARLLIVPALVLVPVVVATFGIMLAWWIPPLAFGLSAAGFLALAWAGSRREARDLSWWSLRCAGCGARVTAEAVACPWCHSLDLGDQWALLRLDAPNERHRAVRAWSARKREQRRQYAEWAAGAPEWATVFRFLASDTAMLFGSYARFMFSGMSVDPEDPADMRWWSAALFVVAGVIGMFTVAAGFETWSMGFAFFGATIATSAAVAVAGPLAMVERDSSGRPGADRRSLEQREAAAAMRVEVNAVRGAGDESGA